MSTNPLSPRQALLERVIHHFVEHGVGDTSLRALATKAGTSHRMLIYHFGSREGLLTAVAAQIWESQRGVMEDLADAHPGDPARGAWLYWKMLADRDAVAPLVFEMSAQAMHEAPWKGSFIEGHGHMVEEVAERLVAAGEPRRRALTVSRMYVAVMLGALWELRLTGDRKTADATVRAVLRSAWPSAEA